MATAATALRAKGEQPKQRNWAERENLWLVVGVLVLVCYPFLDEQFGFGRIGTMGAMLIYVILALGLNIVIGYAGLLDLGYAAFFAIGAYTIGFLTSPGSYFIHKGWVPEWMQHFWPAIAVSWVVAAVFGVLLGVPTLRLRGDYLAIVTLGFGEIVPNFFLNADKITNGTRGVNPIGKPRSFEVFDHEFSFTPVDQRNWYWLILAIVLLTVLMIRRFHNSRLGRTWEAIREDEIAAASMGVNLVSTKLWAFALGASFSGFAGSVYASYYQIVSSDNFQFQVSVTILAMIILGGLGNIYGVIIGALLIGFFDRILTEELNRPMHWLGDHADIAYLSGHDLKQDKFLVFGLALVIMMLARPEGLFPSRRRKAELHADADSELVHEQQQMYDIHQMNEPAAGERA